MVFRSIYHHSHLLPLYLSHLQDLSKRPYTTLPTTKVYTKMKFILLSALSLLAVFATANPIDIDVGAVVSGAADAAASVGADVDAAVGDII
ncbi:glutathione S-transferase [Aspergillus tubingensis]|uniref:glutathione S-transferase n=1 Tax=Aspergillus tubingensis TaxID=5068 RepID=UPI001578CC8D|nr:glutathione S-transferase [Aspergillus tubingensis]GFN20644.1 glutathione S-transferase [Aspergillus tubingensis]